MTKPGPNFMTPQSELFAILQDHYPMESSLALMVGKLTDQECIDLERAISSRANYISDMAAVSQVINLDGIMQ